MRSDTREADLSAHRICPLKSKSVGKTGFVDQMGDGKEPRLLGNHLSR
jgi:hypothetical protein